MSKSYTERMADFAAAIRYDDLPASVVHDAKRMIMDTIACSIASHYTDTGKTIVKVRGQMGGTPESTVLVTGHRTSCANASYVNAWLANSMDMDDTMSPAGGHFAQSAVLPALAVAEREGSSGKDMIAAVTVGFELTSRIGVAIRGNTRPDPVTGKMGLGLTAGQSWAVFAAAGAAGRLLGFDGVTMAHALGIAGYSAAVPTLGKWVVSAGDWGTDAEGKDQTSEVPMTKYTNYGALAEAGVVGALLADGGMTGDRKVLDGPRGFWRMVGAADIDWEVLVGELGQSWNVGRTSFKPYPSSRETQAPIWLFEKLMAQHELRYEELDRVEVGVSPYLAAKWDHWPIRNQRDTQFSPSYALAMSALGRTPGPQWENPAFFQDERVLAFMKKVRVVPWGEADEIIKREQAKGEWKGSHPVFVDISARGEHFRGTSNYAPGDALHPEGVMSDHQLTEKFRNLSYGMLRTDQIENAIDAIWALDEVPRIGDLVRLLS